MPHGLPRRIRYAFVTQGLLSVLAVVFGVSLVTLLTRDALVMAFNDEFFALTVGIAVVLPLVLLLKPLPKGQVNMAMH